MATPEQLAEFAGGGRPHDGPTADRFVTPKDGAGWYNAWLRTIPPPEPAIHPRFGWDPVYLWYDGRGEPVFWYVVGTGGQPTLVIEGGQTMLSWAHQYYAHYKAVFGEEAAEEIMAAREIPERKPPEDVDTSTSPPETLFILERRGLRG